MKRVQKESLRSASPVPQLLEEGRVAALARDGVLGRQGHLERSDGEAMSPTFSETKQGRKMDH